MRNPNVILSNLNELAKDKQYEFKRLYRNLYNPEFFLDAYDKIKSNKGSMTKGINDEGMDGFNIEVINNIISELKDESYKPKPVKRTYIPKANGKTRPLGIPAFRDRLVQEVARRILETVYEPIFHKESHGFRPAKSCHTALKQITETMTGTNWYIEGDIKDFFDNIDHHVLIEILRKRIKDEKFIRLIYKMLRAGFIDDWKYNMTHSGTPQGGIISPLLANIYLNELDNKMAKIKSDFDKSLPLHKMISREYRRVIEQKGYWKKRVEKFKGVDEDKYIKGLEEYNKRGKLLLKTQHYKSNREDKKIFYTRYADDFLIGILGSKEDANNIKEEITNFLRDELKLELSQEKTLITHSEKRVHFLGYDIVTYKTNDIIKGKDGRKKIYLKGKVGLMIPKNFNKDFLNKEKMIKDINSINWRVNHIGKLLNLDDLEILEYYNSKLRGIANYYHLATNVSTLSTIKSYARWSFLKTLAAKHKSKVFKISKKYTNNGILGVGYSKKGEPAFRPFFKESLNRKSLINSIGVDLLPQTAHLWIRTSLMDRMDRTNCELCGKEEDNLVVHHVRKVKDLKGKNSWERIMIEKRRKTLVVCKECHYKIHNP